MEENMFQYSEYVYAVYQEKSFTKAAARLFVSQPALSAMIKKAEEKLKIKIFDRSTYTLSLTQEGEAYIEAIEKLHAIQNEFENRIMDIANLNVGTLTVSGAHFISSFVLSKVIERFSATYPGISVKLIESSSKELEEYLMKDMADMLFDYSFDEKLIQGEVLLNEKILVAVPRDFKINKKLLDKALTTEDIVSNRHTSPDCPSVKLNAFAKEGFLLLKDGNSMNFKAKELSGERGFEPRVTMQLDQLMTAYNLCNLGMGITLLSDTLIKSVPRSDNLLYYKILSDKAERSLYIGYKKNKHINGAMQKFIAMTKEIYSEY